MTDKKKTTKTELRSINRLSNLRYFESEIHCTYDYSMRETIHHQVFKSTSSASLLKAMREAEKECAERIRVLDECWLAKQSKIEVGQITSIDGMMTWVRTNLKASKVGGNIKLSLPLPSGHFNTYMLNDPSSCRYALEEISLLLEDRLPFTPVTALTRHLVRQHIYENVVNVDPLSAYRIFN